MRSGVESARADGIIAQHYEDNEGDVRRNGRPLKRKVVTDTIPRQGGADTRDLSHNLFVSTPLDTPEARYGGPPPAEHRASMGAGAGRSDPGKAMPDRVRRPSYGGFQLPSAKIAAAAAANAAASGRAVAPATLPPLNRGGVTGTLLLDCTERQSADAEALIATLPLHKDGSIKVNAHAHVHTCTCTHIHTYRSTPSLTTTPTTDSSFRAFRCRIRRQLHRTHTCPNQCASRCRGRGTAPLVSRTLLGVLGKMSLISGMSASGLDTGPRRWQPR